MRLLYRFFDPKAGRILINGQDISKLDIDSLRKVIGVVPQVNFHHLTMRSISGSGSNSFVPWYAGLSAVP